MNNSHSYQKFTDAIMSLCKFSFKVIMSNIYAAVLNFPLVLALIFFRPNNEIVGLSVLILLSVNIIPTAIILIRHFRDDLSIIKTSEIVYKENFKSISVASLLFVLMSLILYVDIYFFKNINLEIVELIFSGLLIGLIVFTLNFVQVASIYKSNLKNLMLINIAYTKELSLSAFTVVMYAFVLVLLSIFVVPIISIIVIGTCVAVHNWFSTKAIKVMQEKVSREDITEY